MPLLRAKNQCEDQKLEAFYVFLGQQLGPEIEISMLRFIEELNAVLGEWTLYAFTSHETLVIVESNDAAATPIVLVAPVRGDEQKLSIGLNPNIDYYDPSAIKWTKELMSDRALEQVVKILKESGKLLCSLDR